MNVQPSYSRTCDDSSLNKLNGNYVDNNVQNTNNLEKKRHLNFSGTINQTMLGPGMSPQSLIDR